MDAITRYHELVDRAIAGSLTPDDECELSILEGEFCRAEEPALRAIEHREAEEQRRHSQEMSELQRLAEWLDAALGGSSGRTPHA